ncbi:MAG: hypothetical protein ABSE73_03475 [Planctomycetota bacterium]
MNYTTPKQTGPRQPRRQCTDGFSLVEVMFAIGMLGIGIVGVLSLFTTGIQAAAWSNNMTAASMEAQSLYTQVMAEVDPAGNRIYLCRIDDPKNPVAQKPANYWIHTDSGSGRQWLDPVLVSPDMDWWWQCRVSKYPMDPDDPLDYTKDADQVNPNATPYPIGLYQIAIAVYRNWKPPGKPAIVVFTTFVIAGY